MGLRQVFPVQTNKTLLAGEDGLFGIAK